MPKLLHHVTLEVFAKAHDSVIAAYEALDALVPVPVKEVLATQWRWHPEKQRTKIYELPKQKVSMWEAETPGNEGPITVITYRFTKQRDTQAFIEKLRTLAPEERKDILEDPEGYIDAEGKLSLRLNRKALRERRLSVEKGPSVMARLNLAAYPKNWDTCLAVAEEILGEEE
jgi:RNA binding exosome subunit